MQDLNRYLELAKQLDRAREILLNLQEAAVPGAQKLTGMPRTPGVSDKVGNLAIEIADTKTAIEEMEQEIAEMRAQIDAFIKAIPDLELRTLFRLRFVRMLTYEDIAEIYQWKHHETTYRRRIEAYMRSVSNDAT